MTEQTIYNPVLLISARILETLTFLISRLILGDLREFGKEFGLPFSCIYMIDMNEQKC